ncbi:hypothetical protein HY495_02615 [Candidatus Woesearchaeota archaeon]|nr:hypothetical protein [Candidatus Woesearchaeota archaeon]
MAAENNVSGTEKEASATKEEASAVRRLGSSFRRWATTYDTERERSQARSIKSGAQSVGRGAGKAVGAVGSGVGRAAGAVGGAVEGSAAAVGGTMLAGAKSSAVMLVVLGAIAYFLRLLQFNPAVLLAFSIALFFISGYAVAAKLERERLAVLLPMIFFLVWYWALDATLEPTQLIWFLVIAAAAFALVGLLTKGAALPAEAIGFLPVIILFLDIGLLPFMIQKLELTIGPTMEVLLFIPWWFMAGLLLLPAQPTESKGLNSVLGLLKIVSLVVLVLALVLPGIPNVGYETVESELPTFQELQQAQADVLGKLPAGEHPFIANMMCLLGGDFTNINGCVLERQRRSQLTAVCQQKEEVKQKVVGLDDCLVEEQKKITESAQAAGAVDKTIKPTLARLDIPPAPLQYAARPAYSATLFVENPRETDLNFLLNCTFRKGSDVIVGEVSTQGNTAREVPLSVKTEAAQIPLTCSPAQDFSEKEKTSYIMTIQATIQNMKTESSVERGFLGQVSSEEEKRKVAQELIRDRFSSQQKIYSKAPAEFARINFGIGMPEQNPIITSTDIPRFVASVENVAGGKILAIRSFSYSLAERGFSVRSGQQDCLSSKELILPDDVPLSFGLSTCFLNLPGDLSNFQGKAKVETFFATLIYDYSITREATVQVQVIGLG